MAKQIDYLILGSGIAGMATAEEIRKRRPDADITMISKEEEFCFNRPMLNRAFALDGSGDRFFAEQASWADRYGVNLQMGTRAVHLDPKKKQVQTTPVKEPDHIPAVDTGMTTNADDPKDHGGILSYEKLIYAMGADARIPDVPGADLPHVFPVRTLEDMKGIRSTMKEADHAVVIGGGVLGLEEAWELHQAKIPVTILEQASRLAAGQLDEAGSDLMKRRVERVGVVVRTGVQVERIEADRIMLAGGEEIPADLVVLAIGVDPCTALAQASGLICTESDGQQWLQVDRRMQTSDPDIYAAGDAVILEGNHEAVWERARQMGKVAGINAAGDEALYEDVVQNHVFNGFDTELFTLADSSGARTKGKFLRHADVEIFDFQRERYIRISLAGEGEDVIAGVLLINAPELATELIEAHRNGAGEEEARSILQRWRASHQVDFEPAATAVEHRGAPPKPRRPGRHQ